MARKLRHRHSLIYVRSLSQILFLLLFFFLFRKTDFSPSGDLPYAVNIVFRLDPLVALTTTLAAKKVLLILFPALITLVLTLIFGRFFCGWICPLGTILDGAHHAIKPRNIWTSIAHQKIKYGILAILIVAAIFGYQLVGLLDPFSILVRAMAVSLDPALYGALDGSFGWLYRNAPSQITAITEPIYSILKNSVMPFNQKAFLFSMTSLLLLAVVIALESLGRRFWCRNLCPLGALLAWTSRFALFKAHGGVKCAGCMRCETICRTGAIHADLTISPESCIMCMDCLDICPQNKIKFSFATQASKPVRLSLSRRAFIGSIAAGAILPAVAKPLIPAAVRTSLGGAVLLRPPGALDENEFLARCVRCGECMKVCIGNALHPAFLETGFEGMFSPRLIPRLGYCEFNCTLCGEVCPTGAIVNLDKEAKQRFVIGTAIFDKNRCLPYAKNTPCIVCEEHCPTPDKAIKFKEAEVVDASGRQQWLKQPYIIDSLCIGCGVCETKCPIPGKAAVLVFEKGGIPDELSFY